MESQPTGQTQSNIISKVRRYFDGQRTWLVIAIIILALFTYGEITGTRYFFAEDVEDWKPNSSGSNGGNHYYRRVNHK